MDNFLNNGTVLPSGLLGHNMEAAAAGFNKTYRNFPLRIGIVVASYPVSDINNVSKLTTEYDVVVVEQNENKGTTNQTYNRCMSSEGFGSIADFFERSLRPLQNKKKNTTTTLKGQDGAIVLLLCLDGMAHKGIIISSLTHPDRKTNLTSSDPYLQGEYNGINVLVDNDGSATFTFKGATDNSGNVVDSSQGNTVAKIEKDGSFQINHSTITFRLDRSGTASLTTAKDLNIIAQGNINIEAINDTSITTQGNTNINTQGSTSINTQGSTSINTAEETNIISGGTASVTAPLITLNGLDGEVLTTASEIYTDLITGFPTQGVPTVKAG